MYAETIVWGRGRAVAALVASLIDAGVRIREVWYQDALATVPPAVGEQMQRAPEPIPLIGGVNSSAKALERLERLPEIGIVCEAFYTKVIRRQILDRVKVINIHPAPLPRYRGAHPLPWQILRGEIQSAVTFHLADTDLDAGPILDQAPFRIEPSDNYGSVLEKVLAAIRASAGRVFCEFSSGHLVPVPQNHGEATYVAKRAPHDGWIEWTLASRYIRNFVRALTEPLPGAWSCWNGRKVIFDEVDTNDSFARYVGRTPGQVATLAGGLGILTGDSAVVPGRVRDAETGLDITREIRANDRFSSPVIVFADLPR
ncbi:MAG TPA: formyltransferase family protein [Candidatus Binatia bacterium]|jgi:methionyl-tRNA formyltransferase